MVKWLIALAGATTALLGPAVSLGDSDSLDSFEFTVVPDGAQSGGATVRVSGRSDQPSLEPVVSQGTLVLSRRACVGRYDVVFRYFSSKTGNGRSFTGGLTVDKAMIGSRRVHCPLSSLTRFPASRVRLSVRSLHDNVSCRVLRIEGQRGIGGRRGATGRYVSTITSTQAFVNTRRYRIHAVFVANDNTKRSVTLVGRLRLNVPLTPGVTCLPRS